MGHQARRLSRHLPAGLLVLREQDSNLRPPDQQSGALPTELSRTDETGQSPKETGPLERHVPSAQRVVARDAEAGGLLSEPCRRPECTWTRAGIKPAAAAAVSLGKGSVCARLKPGPRHQPGRAAYVLKGCARRTRADPHTIPGLVRAKFTGARSARAGCESWPTRRSCASTARTPAPVSTRARPASRGRIATRPARRRRPGAWRRLSGRSRRRRSSSLPGPAEMDLAVGGDLHLAEQFDE